MLHCTKAPSLILEYKVRSLFMQFREDSLLCDVTILILDGSEVSRRAGQTDKFEKLWRILFNNYYLSKIFTSQVKKNLRCYDVFFIIRCLFIFAVRPPLLGQLALHAIVLILRHKCLLAIRSHRRRHRRDLSDVLREGLEGSTFASSEIEKNCRRKMLVFQLALF